MANETKGKKAPEAPSKGGASKGSADEAALKGAASDANNDQQNPGSQSGEADQKGQEQASDKPNPDQVESKEEGKPNSEESGEPNSQDGSDQSQIDPANAGDNSSQSSGNGIEQNSHQGDLTQETQTKGPSDADGETEAEKAAEDLRRRYAGITFGETTFTVTNHTMMSISFGQPRVHVRRHGGSADFTPKNAEQLESAVKYLKHLVKVHKWPQDAIEFEIKE